MRPALSTTSLRSFTVRASIEAAHRLGYAGIEIWAEHLWSGGESPAALARLAAAHGLVVTVHGPSRDLNVTSSNPGIRSESRRQYRQALEDAARLGARIATFHPGARSSSRDSPDDYWVPMVDFFGGLGAAGARLGVLVAVENMEERPAELITDPRAVARLVDAVGDGRLGLTLDVAHLLFNRKPIDLVGLEAYVRHVHLSGSTETLVHVPLAEGVYPLGPALARLGRFYTGIVAFEGYAPGREMETVEANRRAYDRLLADVMSSRGVPTDG